MPLRTLKVLVKYYLLEAVRTRLSFLLLLMWSLVFVAGIAINTRAYQARTAQNEREANVIESYLAGFPNVDLIFTQFYTLRRPSPPLSVFASGTDYMAPDHIDYRPRFSPTPYFGDDVDPMMRLFRPMDLTTIVGIIGFVLAILLCYDAVNGEVARKNILLLFLHGVRLWHVYVAKVVAFFILIAANFVLVYAVACAMFFAQTGRAPATFLPALIGMLVFSLGYILFSVISMCALSVLFRHVGGSLVFGVGLFIAFVYVTPFLAEYTAAKDVHFSAGDLMEEKLLYSRKIHVQLDPPPERPVPATYEQLKTEYTDWMGPRLAAFALNNSNAAMEQDERFFARLFALSDVIERRALLLSPFMSFSSAISLFGDTSSENEKRYTTEFTRTFFLKYRSWYLETAKHGLKFGTPEERPFHQWMLTPGKAPIDFGKLGRPQYPMLSTQDQLAGAARPFGILLAYGLVFLVGGWLGLSRLRVHA